MTAREQARFWALTILGFGLILWVLSDILLPFVAAMAIAYFLDPLVDQLEKRGMKRIWAITLIVFVATLAWIALLLLMGPALYRQGQDLVAVAPGYLAQIRDLIVAATGTQVFDLIADPETRVQGVMRGALDGSIPWARDLLEQVWSGGQVLFNAISIMAITPIVSFYLLVDWDRMIAKIDQWLPRQHRDTIARLASEIDDVLSGFVRGTGTVCLILATFYATALSAAGLQFGLFVGLIAGAVSFVPFLGFLVGLGLSLVLALFQFWPDYAHISLIVGIFLAGQVAEGNVLTPWLVGNKVRLHPVWIMFALFAFGVLFGFVGVLLAIPLAAAIGVMVRFALERYLESPVFLTGSLPPPDEPDA